MFDKERFRSFAERYVVQRAIHFKPETEAEDAWAAVERAKMLYKHIDEVGERLLLEDREQHGYTQAAMQGAGRLNKSTKQAPQTKILPGAAMMTKQPSAAINSQAWTGRKTP